MRRQVWTEEPAAGAAAPAEAEAALQLQLARAVEQLAWALDREPASVPMQERLTIHAPQAAAAARQICFLRILRGAEPQASALSEAQLAAALRPLARRFPRERPPSFSLPAVIHMLWHHAGGGDVRLLLEQCLPVPAAPATVAGASAARAAAAAAAARGAAVRGAPSTRSAAANAPAGEGNRLDRVFNGPFDRGSGLKGAQRHGARFVRAPSAAEMPSLIKYRHCRTPLVVPRGFDGALVTRSAQPPRWNLRRRLVHGFNGTGKHNRAPNLFALPGGKALYCAASLAVVEDVGGGQQAFFDGHDEDISCVAMHPKGELVVTGQGSSAQSGSQAVLVVWQLDGMSEVARFGRVLDERVGDGVSTKPYYTHALCAAAFSPDGKLVVAVGTDDQHMIGVWDWRKGQLVAKPIAGIVARPLGVHQLAIAPHALEVDAKGRAVLMLVLVGTAAAPKFGRLAPAAPEAGYPLGLTLKPGVLGGTAPKALSCVAFGGADAFPSPSAAKHGLTFVGAGDGRIFVFDAPSKLTALRSVAAHDGGVSALCFAGGSLASGGVDGLVHLWVAAAGGPGALQRAHTYPLPGSATAKAAAAARARSAAAGGPLLGGPPPAAQPLAKAPPAAGDGLPALTTGSSCGAIRSLAVVRLGAARGVAPNQKVQIPTLLAGTARCALWRLEPQASHEVAAGHFGEATAVAAHPTVAGAWASCGADRQLMLWRAGQRVPAQRAALPAAARCVAFSPDGALLATGHADGTLALVRVAPLDGPHAGPRPASAAKAAEAATTATVALAAPRKAEARPSGTDKAIETLAFSPSSGGRGGLLACGGHDRCVRLFALLAEPSSRDGEPPLRLVPRCVCRGHAATVTHMDWSADGTLLMSNCAAHEVLCWAMPSGQMLPASGAALAGATWASWTCVLGFPVMGIWPDFSDGTDINAVHRSADGELLLTADDFGGVKVFNAPCVVEDAPHAAAGGHSSHVTGVRFLLGDRSAVTSGGADRTIVLWDLEPAPQRDLFRAPVAGPLPVAPRRECLLRAPAPAAPKAKPPQGLR